MKNPSKHIRSFAFFYCISTLGFALWMYFQKVSLSLFDPVLFINTIDFSKQIILSLGIPQALIQNHSIALWMDLLFILLPVFMAAFIWLKPVCIPVLAGIQVVYNFVYCICLSLLTTLSIEGFAAFMLIPILFLARNEISYQWIFRTLRYAFVILFFSTAIWKIRAGGLFNEEQLSAILFLQHANLLTTDSSSLFTDMIRFLINHPGASYILYLFGFFCEFLFIIGLFTQRYDKILCIAFLSFLIMDLILMRINYFSWLSFAGLLYFSRFIPPLSYEMEKNQRNSSG